MKKGDEWRNKEYVLPFTKTTLLEIFFAIYGCMGVFIAIFSGNPIFTPTLAIPTIGFIYIAYLSIAHSSFRRKSQAGQHGEAYAPAISASKHMTGSAMTATRLSGSVRTSNPRLGLAGIIAFLIVGVGIAYYGYVSTMYPLNKAVGFLTRAETAQTPEQLAEYIKLAQDFIPEKGNPVWLFPTLRTDFSLIRAELSNILTRADALSKMPPHSQAYNMAMMDMHGTVDGIEANLTEALPYMYVSLANITLGALWVATIIAIFAALRKARTRHLEYQTISS
jgi:hypothetical protein